MLFLDALVRFGGLALLLAIALASWRYNREWNSTPYLVLACISVGALFMGYAPPALQPPEPLYTIARFVDVPHLSFVWLFALSLYDHDFELRRWHIVVGTLYAAPILWPRLAAVGLVPDQPQWLPIYGGITSILLIGHLAWVTLRGKRDDLLETRRASRTTFVALLLVVTIAAAASELIPRDTALDHRTAKIIAIMPALIYGAAWMLRFNMPAPMPKEDRAVDLCPKDRALLDKLSTFLISEHGHRDPSLTIVKLASQLGVSQHRLRALINTHLGHANFSAFLNGIRIDAVCEAMEAPETSGLPILSLSLDAGFTSLSSFNKAFKRARGMTPSEYRAQLHAPGRKARNPSAFARNPQDALEAQT